MCSIKAGVSEPLTTPLSWLLWSYEASWYHWDTNQDKDWPFFWGVKQWQMQCSDLKPQWWNKHTAEWGAESQSESQRCLASNPISEIVGSNPFNGWDEVNSGLSSSTGCIGPSISWVMTGVSADVWTEQGWIAAASMATAVTVRRQWPGPSLALCCGLLLLLALLYDLFKCLHLAH